MEIVSERGSSRSSEIACASSIAVGRRSEDQEETEMRFKEIAFPEKEAERMKRVVVRDSRNGEGSGIRNSLNRHPCISEMP